MNRDPEELNRWLEEHPVLAWAWTIGIAVLILFAAIFLDWASRGNTR